MRMWRCLMFLVLALPALCYAKVDRVEVISRTDIAGGRWGAVGAYEESLRASILSKTGNNTIARSLTSTRGQEQEWRVSSRLILYASAKDPNVEWSAATGVPTVEAGDCCGSWMGERRRSEPGRHRRWMASQQATTWHGLGWSGTSRRSEKPASVRSRGAREDGKEITG